MAITIEPRGAPSTTDSENSHIKNFTTQATTLATTLATRHDLNCKQKLIEWF